MKDPLITLLSLVNHPQVYGHKSSVSYNAWEAEAQEAKARSLADRWSELSRKLRLDIEIQVRTLEWFSKSIINQLLNQSSLKELDETGGYSAVEVVASPDCGAGGVIQMRQVRVWCYCSVDVKPESKSNWAR